ncbi:hypothetical protein C8R42DRAFT_717906 [Lentinula raphanica]|nr:hypothetical protein C8R42DRAFT_717906 [Lentinula raphanica]
MSNIYRRHVAHQSDSLWLREDEAWVSDVERLSAFYPNAAYDFYGTPGNPLCVYKSGNPWPVRSGPESQRIIREARSVTSTHRITENWLDIGNDICTLLDDKKVRWTSVDPVSFADKGKEPFCQLLLWIGVEPASLSYEDAKNAADAIERLLSVNGFPSIQIAFRESIVTRSVSGPRMLNLDPLDPLTEVRKPFTPTLGLPISLQETPHLEGTGALYLRESRQSRRIFLLTCAHVVSPPPINTNKKNPACKNVIALGQTGYNNAIESMMGEIAYQKRSIRLCENMLRNQDKSKEDQYLKRIEGAKKKIEMVNDLHSGITKCWTHTTQRIIGQVAYVEAIGVQVKPYGYTRDWALIELDSAKFDWSAFKGNQVYLDKKYSPMDYGRILSPHPKDWFVSPEDCLLRVSGVVSANEIHNPNHLDRHENRCHFVVKNGLGTGTTFGRAAGMESFTRTYNESGSQETSIEIAVLPYSSSEGPFSASGDSGSIVVTRDGRILGMITSGAGIANAANVTYLTPFWFILKEIKKVFPDCQLYEVVDTLSSGD